MIPAPGQGAIGIVCRSNQLTIINKIKPLHDEVTGVCVNIEREFLRLLEGGCTAPIGAFAQVHGSDISFQAGLFSLDGKEAITINHQGRISEANYMANKAVKEVLSQGGDRLMEIIKEEL